MDARLQFRKATAGDLPGVVALYRDAIRSMESAGIFQWDDVYPNETILRQDIEKQQLFMGCAGNDIASVFVLNQECDAEYQNGNWDYKDASFFVIHRLCVNPSFQNQGIGKKTMDYIETTLKNEGIETIRLDAFSQNPFALRLYEKRGYKAVGEANWRKGLFYLFEKHL